MQRITIKRARTWHCRRMRHYVELSNGLAPSSQFRSWLDCIINTSGCNFRKGQDHLRDVLLPRMYDHFLSFGSKRSLDRPHAHAQISSYRSPSVERFRIHIKGMVGSPGWLDGFLEVGRR